jgi:glycine dehydrogenase subunit 1
MGERPRADGFTHPYLGLTPAERAEMLSFIGVSDADQLFDDIPETWRPEALPQPLSERELFQEALRLASRNLSATGRPFFLGGTSHQHYLPAAAQKLVERGEFLTSYTPYQPEISQGMLQAIFEYQSMIAELTGLDTVNASHYTYGTCLGEAAYMAHRLNGRKRVVVCGAVNPERLEILRTYCFGADMEVLQSQPNEQSGELELAEASSLISEEASLVYAESPNYFGILEPRLSELAELAHEKGALFCQGFDLISLALVKPPRENGADIAVGEGVGFPMSFGGPGLGIFATKREHVRAAPGRLVGATVDANKRRGYVITLQTREQHIRREKATSNITTNSSINALANAAYLALLGTSGLRNTAQVILSNTRYVQKEIAKVGSVVAPAFSGTSYQDFSFRFMGDGRKLVEAFKRRGVVGPVASKIRVSGAGQLYLGAVTELTTIEHVEELRSSLEEASD